MKRIIWRFLALIFACGLPALQAEHPVRTWTSNDGVEIPAALVRADSDGVVLKLRNGREATVPINRLSRIDRDYLADLQRKGLAFGVLPIPEETAIDQSVEVTGGPRKFQTEHFEFETDQDVSKGFIAEAARVFEGTYNAIDLLPFGIQPKPPRGMERFKARFLNRASFESEIRAAMPNQPGGSVAGVYLPLKKVILVPYESIGATKRGSQMTLRRTSDTTTLIHEITHQVMHDWLPLVPVWSVEGFAEYIAAVPYQNGRFEFKNAARGLKERLESSYGKTAPALMHPADFIMGPADKWRGGMDEYLSAMMLTYYFVHIDRGGQGEALSAYLALINQARNETDTFILDYNLAVKEFEKERLAFNAQVETYNQDLVTYRKDVEGFRQSVENYNTQVRAGVPEAERIKVPEQPKPPMPPTEPEIPKMLAENRPDGPIDIVAIANARSRPALLRSRNLDAIAAEMKAGFEKIGITVTFREPGAAIGGFNKIAEDLKKRLEGKD